MLDNVIWFPEVRFVVKMVCNHILNAAILFAARIIASCCDCI